MPSRHDWSLPERIVVMGCAGSGKSTLARSLGARLGVPYIARDEILGPGQTSTEYRQAVDDATAGEGWVFDGMPFAGEDLMYARATSVVLLDYSRTVVTWRAWLRAAG